MSLSSGHMYSIPEHPAEDDFVYSETSEEVYTEISTTISVTIDPEAPKKFSSASLPEKFPKQDPQKDSLPVTAAGKTFQREVVNKRLSVSLFDIPSFHLTADSGTFIQTAADNAATFESVSSSTTDKNSKSYLQVQDCSISHSDRAQTPLSATDGSSIEGPSNAAARKDSEHLIFIDLDEGKCPPRPEEGPSVLRGRSRSVQWIQNTFQNVSSKYGWLLEIRRPSDIVEERMRRSREELEMEEPEYESLAEKPSVESRRFSENIVGKQQQRRFFPRLGGHLKDFWREKSPAHRRQEEKDSDQNRPDVCPLFTFPRKGDEDEQILDALRQAMRKCTVVDPTARPTSSTVLDQLSKLLD